MAAGFRWSTAICGGPKWSTRPFRPRLKCAAPSQATNRDFKVFLILKFVFKSEIHGCMCCKSLKRPIIKFDDQLENVKNCHYKCKSVLQCQLLFPMVVTLFLSNTWIGLGPWGHNSRQYGMLLYIRYSHLLHVTSSSLTLNQARENFVQITTLIKCTKLKD